MRVCKLRSVFRLVSVGCVLSAALACDSAKPVERVGSIQHRPRRFSSVKLDSVWGADPATDSAVLRRPLWLAADTAGLRVYDAGLRALVAFDNAGRKRWAVGIPGTSPDGSSIRDLKVDGSGNAWLVDVNTATVTTVSSAGIVTMRRSVSGMKNPRKLAVLGAGRLALLSYDSDSALAIVDSSGRVVRRMPVPIDSFTSVHPLARQGTLASGSGRGDFFFGYLVGDGWVHLDSVGNVIVAGTYQDHRDFPPILSNRRNGTTSSRVAAFSPCLGCALSSEAGKFRVLAGGTNTAVRRYIDEFGATTGSYLSSYELPATVDDLAMAGDRAYVVLGNQPQRIVAYTVRPAPNVQSSR